MAVGVVFHPDNRRILVARRPEGLHQGGLWEFPGGKIEPGEGVEEALARELREELSIGVLDYRPLIQVTHDYPDMPVLLDVWLVRRFSGEPQGREGQPLRWVAAGDLARLPFPAGNRAIIECVQQFADGV